MILATGAVDMSTVRQESFGRLVWRYRRAAGLTQEELAERAGISARAVSDIERGVKHRPRPDTVRLLIEALDVPAEEQEPFRTAGRRFRPVPAHDAEIVDLFGTRPPSHPSNLPDEPTPFIGREREIGEVLGLLQRPGVRLVTLAGVGGSGKSRLALQVAARLLPQFQDGVFFVPLAALSAPALVPSAIATVLGSMQGGARPPIAMLKEQL
jgi:transcriptional regulator with XRE-family HTH domain